MAEYINLAWPPTYRAHSYQQQQAQQQPSIHGQLQQAQYQNLSQNPNINPNAGPSSRPQGQTQQTQTQQQTSYTYAQYPTASASTSTAASTSAFQATSTSTAWTSPATATATAAAASASTSTPTAFRAPAHKHAHHLHSIPPREKSTRTLIIDHMLWVHGRTRFAQARAELGMTDRTGGPSSSNYTHRRRPESYAESDDEMSAGEDTQPLRARQGDPGNPHADTEDARRSRQDLALARNLRLRAEGVEKVVIGMLEGGPGGGGTSASSGGSRPGVGRTGTGNSRTTSSGSSPNRLPNGVRLRLALGTIINDLFARQAPPPPHRHTQSAAAAAASSPSTSRTSGSTPASTGEQGVAVEDDDEELPRALWTLAPASAAFVRPRRRARRKTKTKKKKKMQQKRPTQAPSSSGQREPMPSSMASSTPAYLDYSARFPPPVAGSGGDGQWHSGYQAMQQQQQQQHSHQQYHGHGHSQSPPYQQYSQSQQRPSSSSSSLSLHHRPSSSSSQMMTSPNAHYGQSPHPQQSQQQYQQQYSQPRPSYPQQTPPRALSSTQGQFNSSPKPKPTLPVPSSRVTRLYSVGADPDSANAPPAFRCPRHLHTGCDICVEAKAAVSAISAKGAYRDTRITSPGMPSASVSNTGTAISYTPYTYAPGAGSSYAATQGQGLNSWKMSVMPGGLVPGGGGITGWQDGSGIGSGLLRPGVRGSALRRKTVVPGYGLASSSGTGDGGAAAAAASERRGAGNTKLSRLIPRFIKLSALVAAELGRESRGEEVGVGPSGSGSGSGSGSAGAVSPQRQAEAGSSDRYTPPPPNSRRSSDVTVTPRQGQRTTTNSSPIANTTPTQPKSAQTNAPSSSTKEKDASNANALRPTKEWYMLLAGLLTRAVLEGYLTGGWRGLRAVQCLMMVGLGVSDEGVSEGDTVRKAKSRRKADDTAGDADDEDDDASNSDSQSSSTDSESSDSQSETPADNDRTRIGLGFRFPVAAQDDGADNEDGDEEFAELDPDELPDLVEAIRILFPSLREAKDEGGADADGDEVEEGEGRGEDEVGEKSGAGRAGVKDEAEVEYEEEMLERLRRFYAIPESTPDCATHMEDLAWQYPAEPVERAAVRFCEAIARWRGKPELETYKKKPGPNDSTRGGDADTGGMSIDSLVHSNPVSPTMGAAHVHQQQQGQMDSINAALGATPPRKKRQPAIEDYFTGASGVRVRQGQSTSPEHAQRQQQQYHPTDQSDSPSWARSGGGPNKRYRDATDDGGRAEKRMYA